MGASATCSKETKDLKDIANSSYTNFDLETNNIDDRDDLDVMYTELDKNKLDEMVNDLYNLTPQQEDQLLFLNEEGNSGELLPDLTAAEIDAMLGQVVSEIEENIKNN